MVRTRDFVVFLFTAGFLVVAIAVTIALEVAPPSGVAAAHEAIAVTSVQVTEHRQAVVVESAKPLDRSARAVALAEQVRTVLASGVSPAMPGVDDVTAEQPNEPEVSPIESALAAVDRCLNYQVVSWPDRPGVSFVEVEGARLIVQSKNLSTMEGVGSGAVLAQLPWRTHPVSVPACVPYDVVGIATDGSLIRNSEIALYSIFDRDTRVGYALDGFPIHGAPDGLELDDCGGAQYNGQYRYFTQPERDFLIGCFAGGTPQALW